MNGTQVAVCFIAQYNLETARSWMIVGGGGGLASVTMANQIMYCRIRRG